MDHIDRLCGASNALNTYLEQSGCTDDDAWAYVPEGFATVHRWKEKKFRREEQWEIIYEKVRSDGLTDQLIVFWDDEAGMHETHLKHKEDTIVEIGDVPPRDRNPREIEQQSAERISSVRTASFVMIGILLLALSSLALSRQSKDKDVNQDHTPKKTLPKLFDVQTMTGK